MWFYFLLSLLCLVIYLYVWKPMRFWKDRDIPYLTPVPVLGCLWRTLLGRASLTDEIERIYNDLKGYRYAGIYVFQKPTLVILDPEMIKLITVKDFENFLDHSQIFFNTEFDPVLSKNLFAIKGKTWKAMRSTLSPIFTSSRIKKMLLYMNECGDNLVDYFHKEIKKRHVDNQQAIDIEMKDICTRFTNDVIASVVFGIQCDSLANRNNEFYLNGIGATALPFSKDILANFAPGLLKLCRQGYLPNDVYKFFEHIVHESVEARERKHIIRQDVIDLLLEARKGALAYETKDSSETGFAIVEESSVGQSRVNKAAIQDDDIMATTFVFLIGGFDTSASLMTFASYEIAIHSNVQTRLHEEIDQVLSEFNGKITYESINKMKYLDMVLSETLRKWPLASLLERICTKTYVLKDGDTSHVIEKGTGIMIPVNGLHTDPDYYPDPNCFNPDRFSDENKHNIKPFTYIPFGSGPRNCIGSRFALIESKLILIHLLSNFELTVTEKTQIPLKLRTSTLQKSAEKGIWLGLKERTKLF